MPVGFASVVTLVGSQVLVFDVRSAEKILCNDSDAVIGDVIYEQEDFIPLEEEDWRKRVRVERTGDGVTRRPPVLKTGAVTGLHALPRLLLSIVYGNTLYHRTHVGSRSLTGLTKTQGRRTRAHIRSLASGIFSHAVNTGLLESNPWHDVKILGKVRAPGGTPFYTLEEIEDVISALADHAQCQLIMAPV